MERFEEQDIRTAVERVLKYIEIRSAGEPHADTLMLVPAGAAGARDVIAEYVLTGCADETVFYFESSSDIPDGCESVRYVAADCPSEEGRRLADRVLQNLSSFDRVEICAPSVAWLRKFAAGGGERLADAAMYFILTGKSCVIRTPYRPERLSPGRFARDLKQLYEDLRDMGAAFSEMSPDLPDPDKVGTDLITERDVMNAADRNENRIVCTPRAVVTPLAAEKARELNIQIIFRKEDH